jgi:copper chaperone CopZ
VTEAVYSVPGIHCAHCERAVREEVGIVAGVVSVHVDLSEKLVTVRGGDLDDARIRASIEAAGYVAA